jgi:glycosyltransferase involved in cell wall biosynthesis
MSANQPLVSIGLPVYNGGEYLRGALDALTGQDYENIELIISDNCSTDRTEEVCRALAQRDARVRYSRTEKNEGPAYNFERVLELSTGEYFMWAAHDDLWEPSFVSKCLKALAGTPGAVIACSHLKVIDEEGNETKEWRLSGATQEDPAARIRQLLSCRDGAFPIYGVCRREALQRVFPLPVCWSNDFVALAKLCVLGKIVVVPEVLFSYRTFRNKTHYTVAESIGVRPMRSMLVRNKDSYVEMVQAMRASPLPTWERRKLTVLAAVTYGRQWPRWIKSSLISYAYPKYLLPAIKYRESGNRRLAAYYALRAMAANPFYILSRAWVIPLEAAVGPRLAGLAREVLRRFRASHQ